MKLANMVGNGQPFGSMKTEFLKIVYHCCRRSHQNTVWKTKKFVKCIFNAPKNIIILWFYCTSSIGSLVIYKETVSSLNYKYFKFTLKDWLNILFAPTVHVQYSRAFICDSAVWAYDAGLGLSDL
jgi:hypothetical protein